MSGFNINRQRAKARKALGTLFGEMATKSQDPVMELISAAILDEQGNVTPEKRLQGPNQHQADLWVRLKLRAPRMLSKAVYLILRRDQPTFNPRSRADVRYWAASIVLELMASIRE